MRTQNDSKILKSELTPKLTYQNQFNLTIYIIQHEKYKILKKKKKQNQNEICAAQRAVINGDPNDESEKQLKVQY